MRIPYTTERLDSLIGACVEFTEQHESYFMTGNIAGREGVSADIDEVSRMMHWVAEMDKGVLEYSGIGQDNVPYFRLGHEAMQIMTEGGFKKYLRRKRLIGHLEQVKSWSPICISLLALIVSVLIWQTRERSLSRIDELTAQVSELQIHQTQTKGTVATIQASLDTVVSQLREPRRARR